MKYLYDGSYEGFLTVVFDAYKVIEDIEIVKKTDQLNFFEDCITTRTNLEKAERVEKALVNKISKTFSENVYLCFNSKFENKETTVARVTKLVFKKGLQVLNSADEDCRRFISMIKNIRSENHKYKGLLRFKKLENQILFATIEPENDILEILLDHFMKRLKNEKFIIYDKIRNKAVFYANNEYRLYKVENPDLIYADDEDFFERAWINFYNYIKIDSRENKKLMASNMPKKYWQYLPERGFLK
jgi:probable DNA metabolism protein